MWALIEPTESFPSLRCRGPNSAVGLSEGRNVSVPPDGVRAERDAVEAAGDPLGAATEPLIGDRDQPLVPDRRVVLTRNEVLGSVEVVAAGHPAVFLALAV